MTSLGIRTFGGFDISFGEKLLSDASIRRGKMWIALKYLIANHKRPVQADDLIGILWPEDDCVDPANSLKNLIYRLRKILANFGGEGADLQYIGFSQGAYSWNPNAKCVIDAAEFEKYLSQARDLGKDVEVRADLYKKAIGLYRGEFLQGEGTDLWLINFTNYFRRLFYGAVYELADLYEGQAAFEEAVLLYNEAIKVDPYEESLYARQIRILIHLGEYTMAKQQYRNIERLLRKEFAAKPSAQLQSLRLEIGKATEKQLVDLNEIKTNLDNDIVQKNAIFCGPETFRRLYTYDKHKDERMQFPAFLAMVTVEQTPRKDDEQLRTTMKVLRQIMIRTLRKCDIVCQYSVNQFVLMLTVTDEKNRMAALYRIQRLFQKEMGSDKVALQLQAVPMGEGLKVLVSN